MFSLKAVVFVLGVTLLLCVASSRADPVIAYDYPHYLQCDTRWGGNLIVNHTLCAVGCLENSISNALAGCGYKIGSELVHPGTLNTFLKEHNGYTSTNDLKEEAIELLSENNIKWVGKLHPTCEELRKWLDAGRICIANVLHGRHFVLIIGYDNRNEDMFYVHDSAFATMTYSYSKDIVGYRIFDMTRVD
eukprot:GCRY01000792.1.p1 GENE.GCRY01000792.1~~GCRY01000792.1.p1  ORF type:complete len:190 (-),score=21.82 GCRY01000792.1:38-607(-)